MRGQLIVYQFYKHVCHLTRFGSNMFQKRDEDPGALRVVYGLKPQPIWCPGGWDSGFLGSPKRRHLGATVDAGDGGGEKSFDGGLSSVSKRPLKTKGVSPKE